MTVTNPIYILYYGLFLKNFLLIPYKMIGLYFFKH